MIRFFFLFLFFVSSIGRAIAEPIYFVGLAKLKAEKSDLFESFMVRVNPIWKRHGLTLIARGKLIGSYGAEHPHSTPDQVLIIRANSRVKFQDYLKDSEYQMIKGIRLDATRTFYVLEGKSVFENALKFLNNAPLFAIKLNQNMEVLKQSNLSLNISLVANILGSVPPTLKAIKSVNIIALSYDDNPAQFSIDENVNAQLLVLQRP